MRANRRHASTRAFSDSFGATPLIGFIIATVVFSASFYYVVQTAVDREADTTAASNANYFDVAQSLSRVITEKGVGWYTSGACSAGGALLDVNFSPDDVGKLSGGNPTGRFGLGDESCGRSSAEAATFNNLSFAKFANLYRAMTGRDGSNAKVDYEEARASLGLDGRNLDFHLRSWPVLASVRQVLGSSYKDPFIKPLYLADYVDVGGGGGTKAIQHVKGVVDGSSSVTLYVNMTNNGTTDALLNVLFSIPLKQSNVDFTLNTPVVAEAGYYNVTAKVRKTSDWKWSSDTNKKVTYKISDKEGVFQTGSIDLSSITMTAASAFKNVFAESDKSSFKLTGSSVTTKFHYASYDGEGKKANFDDWTYRLVSDGGAVQATFVLPNSKSGFETHALSATGLYHARLMNDALTSEWNADRINVLSTDPPAFTPGGASDWQPGAAVAEESRLIDLVIEKFDRAVFHADYGHPSIPYAAGGDIYPDRKFVMNNDLVTALTDASGAATLDKYNTLIVGSNVDHNAMTSQAAKGTIEAWVHKGGTLIVFGSDQQNVNWLQPLFHSSLDSANGGLHTPDTEHPALNVPNDLDYAAYDYLTEWNYNAGADAKFTHVVQAGASGDLLGIGNPGAFQDGKVILTSWRPYALTANQASACPDPLTEESQCQAIFLVHNLVTLSYRELYLDYGPPIPTDSPTGVHTRIVSVYHPEVKSLVTVQLQVIVFAG